jgi:glycosyltransferase involved in cell wall biosynthesis
MLTKGQVGIFHVHVAERGSFFRKSIIAFMAMAFDVPVIFHMHAAEFREFYGNRNSVVRAYIRRVLGGCSLIIALSESWAAFYASLTSTPVQVIPNFVVGSHSETPARAAGAGVLRILYLGRFGERKGIYDLVRAVRPLYESYPGLMVQCAGDGDIEAARRAVAADGMTDRFRILGWIEPSQRASMLQDSDVYVLPSYAEGLPVAIIEAMEAGLAIVATRVGGIPEMIEHGVNGLLVEPGDVDGLTDAIRRLVDNPQLRAEFGRAARLTYVARYSPEAVIPRLDGIYRELSA